MKKLFELLNCTCTTTKSCVVNKNVWCCFSKCLRFLVGIMLKSLSNQSWFCMQLTPSILAVFAQQFTGTHLNSWVEIVSSRLEHSAQEHNTGVYLYFMHYTFYACDAFACNTCVNKSQHIRYMYMYSKQVILDILHKACACVIIKC